MAVISDNCGRQQDSLREREIQGAVSAFISPTNPVSFSDTLHSVGRSMKHTVMAALIGLLLIGCESRPVLKDIPYKDYPGEPAPMDKTITESGLGYIDLVPGTGASPKSGDRVTVHYTGYLTDGKKFDSSVDRGQPLTFVIGIGKVIRGWDEGVMTMKVGGKRKLIIPPQLGYGSRGAGSAIPPNAELVFDVELLGIK